MSIFTINKLDKDKREKPWANLFLAKMVVWGGKTCGNVIRLKDIGGRNLSKPKILVIEDEAILGLELQEDLTEMGYEVPAVITDGDRVLHAVATYKPDAIIMDIKLFGFRDGIEAAAQVHGFYTTPIIYLSSYPEEEVRSRFQKTSPVAYLEKPHTSESLKKAIELALSKH